MSIISACILLFMVMDPFGNTPLFLRVLKTVPKEKQKRPDCNRTANGTYPDGNFRRNVSTRDSCISWLASLGYPANKSFDYFAKKVLTP